VVTDLSRGIQEIDEFFSENKVLFTGMALIANKHIKLNFKFSAGMS